MSKEKYNIWVAVLLALSVLSVFGQILVSSLAPVALASSLTAITLIVLQMRAKPSRHHSH